MMEPCCEKPENRETIERRNTTDGHTDLVVERCTVCGRRHFVLTVDPVKVGVKVEEM